jgi:hypothetical protein
MSDAQQTRIEEELALSLAALVWSADRKENLNHCDPLSRLENEPGSYRLLKDQASDAEFQDLHGVAASVVAHCRRQSNISLASLASTTSPGSSDNESTCNEVEQSFSTVRTSIPATQQQLHQSNDRHPLLLASNMPYETDVCNFSPNSHRSIQWAHPSAAAQKPVIKKTNHSGDTSLKRNAKDISAGDFEPEQHFYPRVLNAGIHPLVGSFFSLGNERMLHRYTHLNPNVDMVALRRALAYQPKYFMWGGECGFEQMNNLAIATNTAIGADLFNVTTASGKRQMIVVETNSCPSGQKSMPLLHEGDELGGYGTVMRTAFRHLLSRSMDRSDDVPSPPTSLNPTNTHGKATINPLFKHSDRFLSEPAVQGDLAVVYDKNLMEASGYAAAMADVYNERVWLVEYLETDMDPPVRWTPDAVMEIRDGDGGKYEADCPPMIG